MTWIDLDGEWLPAAEARVPVLSHGFLFGDSVYDVIRTYDGKPSLVADHLDRLERSAAKIALPIPVSRAALEARITAGVARAGFDETYMRVIVSRGAGPPNIDPALAGPSQVILIFDRLKPPDPALYETGVPVALVGAVRTPSADIKSGNYLNSILAVSEAHARSAFEGIMLNAAGELTEASTSNVFLVTGGVLTTPELASGILQGITREQILRLAAADGIPVAERRVSREALLGADEAFLSSTIKEVLPISRVDETPLAQCPGPVTSRLAILYTQYVRSSSA